MIKEKQKTKYLNGIRLHRTFVAGIRKVLAHQDYLNKINVFPVPDGDTGTNMAFTLSAILDGTASKVHSRVDKMLELVADSALDGARGNSGAILAQFFQGFSDGSSGLERMSTKDFSNAIKLASEYSREALSEPVEGTILTVITDFSNKLRSLIDNGVDDFESLLEQSLPEAERSLKNTPNLMEVLKKAGVVDAGAQGFVDFLQGINEFVRNGSIPELEIDLPVVSFQDVAIITHDQDNLKYQFCTECMIMGENIDRAIIKKDLAELGDSMVIAGSKRKMKIHIHTNEPAAVFTLCESYGDVKNQKADDMKHQQATAQGEKTGDIAIVTDSGADFIEEGTDIHVVPVRYNFGNKGYIDKVSQTVQEFYEELATNPIHPQTSQPVPGDFKRQYQFLNSHYRSIISIHIPQAVSGTLQSAETAAKRTPESSVTVIDSNNVSVGLGLIVTHAAQLVQAGKNHDEIIAGINKISKKTILYAAISDLSYAVKGGRVPKSKQKLSDILHFTPVLTTNVNGKLGSAGILFGKKNLAHKLGKFILRKLDLEKSYRLAVGHCNCPEKGKALCEYLESEFGNFKSTDLIEVGGALGVHMGPGSLVVGIQEYIEVK